jgi:hypothetical protein
MSTDPLDPALLPPRQFFRFSADVKRCDPLWTAAGVKLDDRYDLPTLADLDGRPSFAAVRMAWSEAGLAWQVEVAGKSQAPWCRDSRLDESDGLQVWVDTRATFNIHRASRFCHRFACLPCGGGSGGKEPVADQLLINRARENARPVRPRELQVKSAITKSGYRLAMFASSAALGGSLPAPTSRLHLRAFRSRARSANIFRGPGVSLRRRPELLGRAQASRLLTICSPGPLH